MADYTPIVLQGNPAEQARQVALAEAAAAEAATSAATAQAAVGVGEQPDTATGLSTLDVGERFWVDQGDGTFISYLIEAGPVATQVMRNTLDITGAGAAANIGTAYGFDVQDGLDGRRSMRGLVATAAALTSLLSSAAVSGAPGATYTVETSPYPTSVNIRGNGATIHNVNTDELNDAVNTDTTQRALPLGVSTLQTTSDFTYYAISAVSGPLLTVGANASEFTVGDVVILHGADSYTSSGNSVYTNYLRANVVAVGATTVMLDRPLSHQLAADTPVIATTAENVASEVLNGPTYVYLLNKPYIENLTIKSDKGNTTWGGGCIDGVFRNITTIGRSGPQLNAMQDCLWDGVRVQAWRKICELAEGSAGTTVRNLRGVLEDSSTKTGESAGTFFVAMNENCADCVFDDFIASSGPNDSGTGVTACQIGSGRNNEIRNSSFEFPAHTGTALSVQTGSTASNSDSGYRNVTVHAPVCSYFFKTLGGGGSIIRPYLIDSKFTGTPATGAANLDGTDGRMFNCSFEAGNVTMASSGATGWMISHNKFPGTFTIGSATGCTISSNYIADGFADMTEARLKANTIEGNWSDKSLALDAVAVVDNTQIADITTTTANTAYKSMVCPAASLAIGDRIIIRARLQAGGAGGGNRSAAVSVTTTGVGRQGCGTRTLTATGSLYVECELIVKSDTQLTFRTSIGGDEQNISAVTVDSLAANDLTIAVEAWVSGTEVIVPYGCRIIPAKAGMRHLPFM